MRIKNVGRSTIVFKGGSLEAGRVAVFQGNAEEIGCTLLATYPDRLIDLDNIKKEDIVDVVVEDKTPAKKATKPKSKK